MKILHTSDWHIGRTLYGRKRYEESASFLTWLVDTIEEERVDVLLVAGDVFDTGTPSNRAQELYYEFLYRVAASPTCRHIVVTAGNHDSPSFLNAPKTVLRVLNVHVTGAATENLEDEVLVLTGSDGSPEMIVCAVPYLRDREIRAAEAGESVEDKDRKLVEGICRHYADVTGLAERKRLEFGGGVPVVAMGHLFTAGGQTVEGDGVRELYVGSLAHVSTGLFPDTLNYVALGHLHVPQKVQDSDVIRYSGSPLPMGFGEAKQAKSVCLVESTGDATEVRLIAIPCFQELERVKGDGDQIAARIAELADAASRAWLEVVYEGDELAGDLRGRLDELVSGTSLEVLRIKNTRVADRVLNQSHDSETLDDLDVQDVFQRCLDTYKVPAEQRPDLIRAYQETVDSLHDDDTAAE